MAENIGKLLQYPAEKFPISAALLDINGRILTYSSLFKQVQELRRQLLALGLGRQDRIALVMPDGLQMATAILSVLCTGTVAPLNPKYRQNEFIFYLKDLQASALIVPADGPVPVREAAEQLRIPLLEMEEESRDPPAWRLNGLPARAPAEDEPVQDDDYALILHTSGTTSRPKMVPLRQRHLYTSAANIARTFQLSSRDRCLNVMPMFHIQGFMACLLAPLMNGASVVCTDGFKPEQFFPWIERFLPSYYSASPTIHQAVIANADLHKDLIRRHPLRFIRSSAAPLPPTVLLELEAAMQAPVIESYGMTEGALQSTSNPLPPDMRKPGSVGRAAGPDIAIVDPDGKILKTGERGEIVMRGGNVMDGYLSNPEANRAAFINGWFRTGDEGYLDRERYLYITGRLKEMINRGGEKVAPREVDEVFLAHPAVAQAVTFAVPHASLGEDVATAVVLKGNSIVSPNELRRFALKRLTDVKAPSRVLILEELPKGPSGKLQRIGLYQVLAAHFQTAYTPARNPLEERIVAILQDLLELPRVGIHDNFFNLGGDSLLAAGLSARLKEDLQAELSIETIFLHPTAAEMVEYILEVSRMDNSAGESKQIGKDIWDYLSTL